MTARIFSIDGTERNSDGTTTVNPAAVPPWATMSADEILCDIAAAIRNTKAAARRSTFHIVAPARGRTEGG